MALLAEQRENAQHDERRECDKQIERESHRVFLLIRHSERCEAQGMSKRYVDYVCLYETYYCIHMDTQNE